MWRFTKNMKYRKGYLGRLNRWFVQWFFLRVEAEIDTPSLEITKINVIGFIVPRTGWTTEYKYVWKEFRKTIWKANESNHIL